MLISDNNKQRLRQAVLAVLLGVTAGLFISGYWLIDAFPPSSRTLIVVTAAACLILTTAYFFGIGMIRRRLSAHTPWGWMLAASIGILIAGFLFFAGTSQWQRPSRYLGFWLPQQHLSLTAARAKPGTAITWINTPLGDVSYESLSSTGWLRQGDRLILQDPVHNSIEWHGKTGGRIDIVFESDDPGGEFLVSWDNEADVLRLGAGKTNYAKTFPVPFFASREFILALGVLQFWVLATAALLMTRPGQDPFRSKRPVKGADAGRNAGIGAEILTVGALMLLAALLRGFNLGATFPAVDEYYHLIAADQLLHGAELGAVYPRGLWVVTIPVAVALRLLGHEVWAARAVGVLFNVLALSPLYMLTRKISKPAAVAAGILYACSPWIITFARVAREYAYYPLYFYLILLVMVELAEAIPPGFQLRREWHRLMRPKVALLVVALLIPPIFALRIDWLSTFRTILIAYLVLGLFLLGRLDWSAKPNWPFIGVLLTALTLAGLYFYREQLTKLLLIPKLNPVPVSYFFPNPPQQWYYDRIGLAAAMAVLIGAAGAVSRRRDEVVPLMTTTLFMAYAAVFALFSKSFFHTRHLLSTQLWFVILVGMGLAWMWGWLRERFPGNRTASGVGAALVLAVLVLNPAQILLPTLSRNPDMPISEDYLHDMSAVQTYLLSHAGPGDALVSTVYGLYATWERAPVFGEQLRINSGTSREEIASFVEGHETGWIVIDAIRLDVSALSERSITSLPQMEYIGNFGDEYVWRWGRPGAKSFTRNYE